MRWVGPVMAAWSSRPVTRQSATAGRFLPEKPTSTNRIGRHFARIKAAGHDPYQLWLLGKSARSALLGHVRAVGRGHEAADDGAAGFGRNAAAALRLALDHSPGGAIGEQCGQRGVVEPVAATDRAE